MAQKRDAFFLPDKKGKQLSKDKNDKKFERKDKRQNNFDENRDGLVEHEEKQDGGKKPFDKKAYRLKKYSKKYKLQQFEEQRKMRMLHKYQKSLKEELAGSYKPKAFDEDTTDSNHEAGKFVRHPDLMKENKPAEKPKKEPFWKEKEYFKKIKQEKLEKREQVDKVRQEKTQKLAEYKKKKQERFKKLSFKNKKGQPVLAARMEMLLDKLQSGSN